MQGYVQFLHLMDKLCVQAMLFKNTTGFLYLFRNPVVIYVLVLILWFFYEIGMKFDSNV